MQAGAAALALPSLARAQAAGTLRFVPYADLAVLDPLTSSFMTRNHALWSTTRSTRSTSSVPQPQLIEGAHGRERGQAWRLTLRRARASTTASPCWRATCRQPARWASRDPFGASLLAATEELSAPSDRLMEFRLKRPFPLLPDALAKPTNLMAAIMPERLAGRAHPAIPKPSAAAPSATCPPSASRRPQRLCPVRGLCAAADGMPTSRRAAHRAFRPRRMADHADPGTQVAALQAGEVDWVDQPLMDLLPRLRRDLNLA